MFADPPGFQVQVEASCAEPIVPSKDCHALKHFHELSTFELSHLLPAVHSQLSPPLSVAVTNCITEAPLIGIQWSAVLNSQSFSSA